jgi:hypothetical protein
MSILTNLDALAQALGGDVSGGQVHAPGPGHTPRDRSLCVKVDPAAPGGFVVHSFAGDDPLACKDYVRERAGLSNWKKPENGNGAHDPLAAMQSRVAKVRSAIVAEYIYRQADGTPYLRVERTEPKGHFRQSHWTGDAWVTGKPAGPKLPYRLPEMLAAVHDPVFVCEGEKDADALLGRGFIATTASEGAGKWTADLNHYFEGRTVYILPDNDEPGRKHARQVADHLSSVAAEVRIVTLPGLPPKGDVSDWLAAGGATEDLIAICRAAPVHGREGIGFTALELQHMRFAPIKYVVTGYIVEGLTILAGRPKRGKSWLLLHAAIAVARGGYTLGDVKCVEGDVLYAALEDNRRRLQSRMTKLLPAFGQDWPPRLHFETEMPRLKDDGLDMVRRWIEQAKEPRLVIIDTLQKVRDPKGVDQNGYEADYAAVSELKALADKYGVAIVLVHHQRKMDAEDPVDTVSGTTGLTGAVDTVLVLNNSGQGMTLYGRGRDIEEIEKAVTFDKDLCIWRVEGEAQDIHRSDERTAIITVLDDATEPLSPQEIADLSELPYKSIPHDADPDGEGRGDQARGPRPLQRALQNPL